MFCLLSNLDELVEYLDIEVLVNTDLEPPEQRAIIRECQRQLALESVGLDSAELKKILGTTIEAKRFSA